jgi:hypothetical protein
MSIESSLIVIVTTSPVPSNPSIKMITTVIKSLDDNVFNGKKYKVIIACDGSDTKNEKYDQFVKNLKDFYSDNSTVSVILNSKKGHLSGNIRNAFSNVNTEFVMLVQHDLLFVKKINVESILEDMKNNPELKHVRFNKRDNIKAGWDNTPLFASKIIKGNNNSYIFTESWSDQNHIAKSEYYRSIVLKEVNDVVFMESLLNNISKGNHNKYGTYIYGDLNDKNVIVHLDGSEQRRGKIGQECKSHMNTYVEK